MNQRHLFCFAFGYCSPSEDSTITGDRYKVARNPVRPPPFYDVTTNVSSPADLVKTDFDANFNTDTHILELRWELSDDYRLDAVYGHWNSSETVFTDWDGTPDMLYHTDRPGNWEQDSVELLGNAGDDPFSWVAGVFFWQSSFDIKLRSYIGCAGDVTGDGNPDIQDIAQFGEQETDSKAAFFEGDYALPSCFTYV